MEFIEIVLKCIKVHLINDCCCVFFARYLLRTSRACWNILIRSVMELMYLNHEIKRDY